MHASGLLLETYTETLNLSYRISQVLERTRQLKYPEARSLTSEGDHGETFRSRVVLLREVLKMVMTLPCMFLLLDHRQAMEMAHP
jgi:hypothetical protein